MSTPAGTSRLHAVAGPSPRTAPWLPGGRARPVRTQLTRIQSWRSFDNDDELDTSLTDEFARLIDPDKFRKAAEHMELTWKISKNRGQKQGCECCRGSGLKECNWCHGTGVFMLGDMLVMSSTGSRHCPICRGVGEVKCQHCKGTGHIAGWMDPGCPVASMDEL